MLKWQILEYDIIYLGVDTYLISIKENKKETLNVISQNYQQICKNKLSRKNNYGEIQTLKKKLYSKYKSQMYKLTI